MSDEEQQFAGLPAELERFLDDWFRSGAEGGWEELIPSLSTDWDAPGGLTGVTNAEPVERTAGGDRAVPLTPLRATADASEGAPSVSSPDSTYGADGSMPSTSGDDKSEKGELSSPTATRGGGKKTLGKPARNASRDRMKTELSYLRHRALELETQLAGLKSRPSADDNQSESQDVGLRSVWKQIAERQLERRRHVESENDRLKGMLTEYLTLARRLEQFLYKRPRPEQLTNEDDNTNLLLKKSRMAASAIDVDDVALVQRFVHELGDVLAVVDSVVEASNALDAPSNSSDRFLPVLKTTTSNDGGHTSFLELSNSCVIPFPFDRVRKAAWLGAKQRYQRVEYVTYDVDLPDDTIAVRYPLYYQEHVADNIVVLRRYVSKDRMVWVWRSLSECSDECRHLLTDETGWSVFQPASATTPGSSSTTTMQSCIRVVPIQRVTHTPSDPTPTEFSELSAMLNDTYIKDEDGVTALVADLLLDEPLGFKS